MLVLQESYEQKSAGFEIKRGDGKAMLTEMATKVEDIFKKNEASLKVSHSRAWLGSWHLKCHLSNFTSLI